MCNDFSAHYLYGHQIKVFFNCNDIISPYQKMPSKVFPLVLPILTNLWVFFKIPKIQKSYNIRAIFLRVLWWSKRLKWSLKSQKTRFFQAFFSTQRSGKLESFEMELSFWKVSKVSKCMFYITWKINWKNATQCKFY